MKHDGQPWERRLAVLAAQEAAMSERQNVATQTANFQAAVKAAMPSTAMDPDEPSTIPPICSWYVDVDESGFTIKFMPDR